MSDYNFVRITIETPRDKFIRKLPLVGGRLEDAQAAFVADVLFAALWMSNRETHNADAGIIDAGGMVRVVQRLLELEATSTNTEVHNYVRELGNFVDVVATLCLTDSMHLDTIDVRFKALKEAVRAYNIA